MNENELRYQEKLNKVLFENEMHKLKLDYEIKLQLAEIEIHNRKLEHQVT